MRKIIGFAGRKRSGKSMLSNLLKQEYDAVVLTIADYLKFLCCDILNFNYETLIRYKDNGVVLNLQPNERWYRLISDRTSIEYNKVKEELQDRTIKDVRDMLQCIGTDVIRKYNENWHVDQLANSIESYSEDTLIVIDDVRFPNEKNMIESMGGKVFFIINTFNKSVSNHISEISLGWRDFPTNQVILNTEMDGEKFKTMFKVHFANNFEVFIPKSIFLDENINYVYELLDSKNPLIIEDLKRFKGE